jgi:hypothetical protein
MTARFRPTDGVLVRAVEGELVLLDLERGEFLVARGLGPKIWELLVSGRSVEDIGNEVASRYGANRERVQSDVDSFVLSLREKGLILEEPGPAVEPPR